MKRANNVMDNGDPTNGKTGRRGRSKLLSRAMSKLDLERRELARGKGDLKMYVRVFRQYMQVLLIP